MLLFYLQSNYDHKVIIEHISFMNLLSIRHIYILLGGFKIACKSSGAGTLSSLIGAVMNALVLK